MNSPQNPKDPWMRLVAGARRAQSPGNEESPFGFATRVAALADAAPRNRSSLFERFALRAVGVAALLAMASVAFTLKPAAPAGEGTSADAASEVAGEDALNALVNA